MSNCNCGPMCSCFWQRNGQRVRDELKRTNSKYTTEEFRVWFKSVVEDEFVRSINTHSDTLNRYENYPEGVVHQFIHEQKNNRIDRAMKLVRAELVRAMDKHRQPFNSHHEGYAVILEELDEYKAEVFKGGSTPRAPAALQTELVQTAAMAARALVDLCL